jgi:two-component system, OmpR family, phosphate regulon sensor histidine kinase PhoR
MNNNKKILLVLIAIVLLPALFYSAYQISALNDTEEMLQEVYARQLDAILFSVNQYVLDVASNWANRIETDNTPAQMASLMESNPPIRSIINADSVMKHFRSYPQWSADVQKIFFEDTTKVKIERLFRYKTLEYRKLEPIVLSDSTFLIIFVGGGSAHGVYGIVIDNLSFVNSVIGKKLNDLSSSEFVLTVFNTATKKTLYTTLPSGSRNISLQKQLWIFPNYSLGIGIQGESLEEAARSRFQKNLVLIALLDVILILGALFIYRVVKKERELVALRSDFVSNVSHELRTPLSLIRMFTETLEMKRVKTEKKKIEYYGIILQETERLTRLVNNILNFSKMESNTRKYDFRSCDINEMIGSIVKVYSYHLEAKGFTVTVQLGSKLPSVEIDEEAIAESLHNIIDNAVKYSEKEKFLRIATAATSTDLIIEIEDHGIGIPKEHQKKIFEKFYRVSQGLVHTAKGSGLGLALVQHIITAHRGTITVESEPEKGSTFVITLPLKRT